MSAADRRRQLIGIGLSKLVEKPIQELAIDEVAAEAGISRGLLFHYFPTKTDFYLAVVEAAGRRVLRNIAPDPSGTPEAQLRETVDAFLRQVERRRDFYLSFVRGAAGGDVLVIEVYDRMREEMTRRVATCLALPEAALPVVHAWWAYVEDRALVWSGDQPARRTASLEELGDHCVAALHALLSLTPNDG